MSSFDQLLDFDPVPASPDARVEQLIALQKLERFAQAQQLRVLAAVALDPHGIGVSDPARAADPTGGVDRKHYEFDALALALQVAHESMPQLMFEAIQLVQRLPRTVAALEDGVVSLTHCRRLVEHAARLDDHELAEVETRVLRRAGEQTPGQFVRSIRRAVLAVETPVEQEARAADALADRRVCRRAGDLGMTELWTSLPTPEATAIWNRMQAHADRLALLKDGRTADQLRADALIDLLLGTSDAGGNGSSGTATGGPTADDPDSGAPGHGARQPGGRKRGLAPQIQVIVALSTLLGIDNQPGELTGHGPIPAALARQLAHGADSTWRRLVTDECGVLLDYGRKTYRPPAALADHVTAKHHVCRMAGCNRPAVDCEIDHRRAWADGGTTCDPNLWPLCARHHHLKHEAGWKCELRDDGTAVWTTPTGHVYEDQLDPLPTDTTMPDQESPPDTDDPPC